MESLKVLPLPIGDYVVGIKHTEFSYVGYEDEKRDISVIIYYPADSNEGKPSYPYAFPEVFGNSADGKRTAETTTHCYADIKISEREKSYPVLIYNHCYSGYEMMNTVLCSDLASKGFIVFSISHPGESSMTKYPDGRFVRIAQKYIDEMTSEQLFKNLEEPMKEIVEADNEDDALLIELGRKFMSFQNCFVVRIKVWVLDTRKAADFIEDLNSGVIDSIFKGKLLIENGLSLTGHSYGGSTALRVCQEDDRFICGINVDGGDFREVIGEDVGKPILTIGNPYLFKLNRGSFFNNTCDAYHVTVKDAEHMGFTDSIFLARENPDRIGTRDPYNMRDLLIYYHLAFYNKYLLKRTNEFGNLNFDMTDYNEKLAK